MVRPAIGGQQREDGTGWHEVALAGCSHHSLARIVPASRRPAAAATITGGSAGR
jgi:hypothetical protein